MAKKIGELLVERGVLTPEMVQKGIEAQAFYGGRIGSLLCDLGELEERDLLDALCDQKKAKPARASVLKAVSKSTLDLIPVKFAVRHLVVPMVKDARRLTVAMADPNDLIALDELQFITGCIIEPELATERTILNALERFYGVERKKKDTVQLQGRGGPAAKAQVARTDDPARLPSIIARADSSATADLQLEESSLPGQDQAKRYWAEDGSPAAASPAALSAPTSAAVPASADMMAAPGPAGAAVLSGPPPAAGEATEAIDARDDVADGHALLIDDGSATVTLEDQARTIEEAARRLAKVEIRDDIADVLLWCTEEIFPRSALFIFQKSRTIGWTGQGQGLKSGVVRKVVMPVEEVSVFTLVRDNRSHYLGPLPKNPANERFVATLGGVWPEAILAIPFGVKGRPIGCLYAEDKQAALQELDLALLFRLLQKAGLALEILLLRSKIVML